MSKSTCDGCRHYLGGGACEINLEAECREGGGFEAWEAKEDKEEEEGFLPKDPKSLIPCLASMALYFLTLGIAFWKFLLPLI